MTSEVDLCNEALASISARATISSLSETSNEAIQCNIYYAKLRDRLLRMANWEFAHATATLSLLKALPGTPENPSTPTTVWNATQPTPPWLYSYAYPSDCMRAIRIMPQAVSTVTGNVPIFPVALGTPAWPDGMFARFKRNLELDGNSNQIAVINTNISQALLRYTAKVTAPDLFDSLFQGALVAVLASALAVALVNDRPMSKDKMQEANAAVLQARAADGNEGPQVIDIVPDWIAARGTRWGTTLYQGYATEPYEALFV